MHVEQQQHPSPGIQQVRVIAVASGKGGVGKTTVAINLALALCARGFRVGLLDADVYGPSIPTMLDLHYQPKVEQGAIPPAEKFGLKIMSIGFLIDEEQAVIWRGPMVSRAIKDFLDKVLWGELDYLVVDLPPGTGDPSITIAQAIPEAQILMVTTPQKVALVDVKRAISMFRKMGKPILGVVENMAFFCCEHSDERIEIFGEGGGEILQRETGAPLLVQLPIDIDIRIGGDKGIPLVVEGPDSISGKVFRQLAEQLSERLIKSS
jgi:ATP-binding protein involved in chromosome partitioning